MADRESAETVVEAPADTVMAVIVDFPSYPEWAANIREVEVLETDDAGRGTRVWYRVDARVLEVEYTLAYTYHDDRLTWALVEGAQIDQLDGEYLLTREDETTTRVRYTLEVDVAFPLPGFLKKRAAKQILETGLGDLRRRAEARAAR